MAMSMFLLLISIAMAAPFSAMASLCSSSTNRKCADVQTIAQFEASLYSGLWYEIGSTATFKLLTESGLRCNQATYTISPNNRLLLTNSGQRSVSLLASASISAINIASASACSSLRSLCPDSADIASSIADIQQLNGLISQASADLPSAVSSIQSAVRRAKSRLSAIRSNSASVFASVSAASASLTAISAAAKALLLTAQPLTGEESKVSSVNGTISLTSVPGKLQVSINGVTAPYWIVDLVVEGEGTRRVYSAALVYSCSPVGRSVFILSRRPQAERGVVDRFLAKARALGILRDEDCNDPFIFTVQSGGNCGSPKP